MRKKIIIAVVLVLLLGLVGYNYMYKSHRDISNESASYTVSVKEVYDNFQKDEKSANSKYLDKTIEISGKITNIDIQSKLITVDEKLIARFTKGVQSDLKLQNSITLKGRLIGYDSLLEEIQMDQCTIKN